MTTAATSLLGLALPVTGELNGTWGDTVNNSITSLLDSAIAGTTTISTDGDVTLTTTTLAANQAREAILLFSGARTAQRTVTAPAQSKLYTVINATTGGFAVKLVGAGPTTGLTIPAGASALVAWNDSDFVEIGATTLNSFTVTGNLTLTAGTANGVAYLNGSKVVTTGSALTFDGTNFGVGSASGNFRIESPSTYLGTGRIGQVSMGLAGSGYPQVGYNFRTTSTTDVFNYDVSDVSSVIQFNNGQFIFKSAASGTAGAAISYSEQMRLTSTGLGIGTSSPAYKLQVYNNINGTPFAWGNATRTGYLYQDSTGVGITNASGTGFDEGVYLDTANSNVLLYTNSNVRATVDSAGNLGLGVTPSAWGTYNGVIDLKGNGSIAAFNQAINISANDYYNGTNWIYKTSTGAAQYQIAGNVHQWYNAPTGTAGNAITFTQAMTLDASGNLLVGVTAFNGAVNNNYMQYGSGSVYTGHVSGTGSGAVYSAFYYNGGSIGSITQAGTTGVLYNITSDYRLKNIAGPVTNSGAFIDKLNPVQGTWKADGSRFIGFLAHELQEASETVVGTGVKDGKEMQSIDYSNAELIANLVAEIQSLRKRLAAAGI